LLEFWRLPGRRSRLDRPSRHCPRSGGAAADEVGDFSYVLSQAACQAPRSRWAAAGAHNLCWSGARAGKTIFGSRLPTIHAVEVTLGRAARRDHQDPQPCPASRRLSVRSVPSGPFRALTIPITTPCSISSGAARFRARRGQLAHGGVLLSGSFRIRRMFFEVLRHPWRTGPSRCARAAVSLTFSSQFISRQP